MLGAAEAGIGKVDVQHAVVGMDGVYTVAPPMCEPAAKKRAAVRSAPHDAQSHPVGGKPKQLSRRGGCLFILPRGSGPAH